MAQQQPGGTSPKRLDIKKYPNRRYYDATRSRHVTLEEINSLIRDGYEIQVTDSKTGQDITAKVLAQIILELDAPKLGVFPVPLLHRLIRANEQLVSDFVEKYFNQALAAFLDSQKTFEQSVRQAMGLQSPMLGVPDWTKLMWGPFNPSLWPGSQRSSTSVSPAAGNQGGNHAGEPEDAAGGGARQHGAAAEASSTNGNREAGATRDMRQQMEELRQQLASLQQQLGGQQQAPAASARKRRSGSSGGGSGSTPH